MVVLRLIKNSLPKGIDSDSYPGVIFSHALHTQQTESSMTTAPLTYEQPTGLSPRAERLHWLVAQRDELQCYVDNPLPARQWRRNRKVAASLVRVDAIVRDLAGDLIAGVLQ